MRLPTAVLGAMEIALNGLVGDQPGALSRCAGLAGHNLALHFQELDLTLYLLPHANGIEVLDHLDDEPDILLSGRIPGFARTLFAANGNVLTGGDLRIEGQVGLAQGFADLLQSLDLDIEEWLAQRLGDVPAHMAGRALVGFRTFARRAIENLSLDAAEYLREETRDIIGTYELGDFSQAVKSLHAANVRLLARVQKLQQRASR